MRSYSHAYRVEHSLSESAGTLSGQLASDSGQAASFVKDKFIGHRVYIFQGHKKGWIGIVKALGSNTALVDIGAAIQGQGTIEVAIAHLFSGLGFSLTKYLVKQRIIGKELIEALLISDNRSRFVVRHSEPH
ncbi:hypothetical protein SCHPADRAFT_1003423 [Schizopora paradoxa]|uniref:Uncharacterized protein n=1 Tax=Schizopora paradoxa TaxID=27342 RepID=A0A0H2QYI5_9AGAM|nr:hypothetical protein SCHPADRAFT_1003423 [Schizopora paradoxa]